MSDKENKEEGLPGRQSVKATRQDERRGKGIASSTETASKESEAEVGNRTNASESNKGPRTEEPPLGSPTSSSPKRENAEERESAFSPAVSKPPPERKAMGGETSPGGNNRGRGKSFIWLVVVILLIIVLVALGNAYYTRFLIAREHKVQQEAQQALAEKLTTQLATQVESRVSSQVDEQLSKLSGREESLEPLRQDIASLKKMVDEHTGKLRAITDLKEEMSKHPNGIKDIANLKRKIDERADAIKTIQREMGALESALQALRTEVKQGSEPEDWSIAEAAYLMRIANERLQLGRDVNTAIIALQTANDIFQKMGNPNFAPVRSELAEEIKSLKAVPLPDIDSMALSLTHLIEQVDELELDQPTLEGTAEAAQTEKEAGQSANQEEDSLIGRAKGFFHVMWGNLKQLVTVQRQSEGEGGIPVLPPEERYFLYQNLRMELEGARLSLLRRSEESFQQSLQLAQKWLKTYFQGAEAEAMKDTLAKLAQTPISPPLPDISGSLKTLHHVLESRKAQAAGDNEGGKA